MSSHWDLYPSWLLFTLHSSRPQSPLAKALEEAEEDSQEEKAEERFGVKSATMSIHVPCVPKIAVFVGLLLQKRIPIFLRNALSQFVEYKKMTLSEASTRGGLLQHAKHPWAARKRFLKPVAEYFGFQFFPPKVKRTHKNNEWPTTKKGRSWVWGSSLCWTLSSAVPFGIGFVYLVAACYQLHVLDPKIAMNKSRKKIWFSCWMSSFFFFRCSSDYWRDWTLVGPKSRRGFVTRRELLFALNEHKEGWDRLSS